MEEHIPDVFVLGAGFSKAISDEMPLLDELSKALIDELDTRTIESLSPTQRILLEDTGAQGFERTLSFLASDQPWLSPPENLRNRALFLELSRHLARVLRYQQNRALQSPVPDWLVTLVGAWHQRRCVVITFNYDTLIEKAYEQAIRDEGNFHYSTTYPLAIMPIERIKHTVLGSDKTYNDTITLLKLHGSTNWLYSGAPDFMGETLFHVRLDPSWRADTLTGPNSLHDRGMDKVPLIVPPTASKVPYFGNEAVDGLWELAAAKLRGTHRLTIMGYSMPTADTMVRDLLQTSLHPVARTRSGELIAHVVDRNDAAAAHYRDVIPSVDFEQRTPQTGNEPIPEFALNYSTG